VNFQCNQRAWYVCDKHPFIYDDKIKLFSSACKRIFWRKVFRLSESNHHHRNVFPVHISHSQNIHLREYGKRNNFHCYLIRSIVSLSAKPCAVDAYVVKQARKWKMFFLTIRKALWTIGTEFHWWQLGASETMRRKCAGISTTLLLRRNYKVID
jgi:hypothetical protein